MIPIQLRRTLFRTRIKVCGMTRSGDVRLASELGADAVGFVFAGNGPRRVEAHQARTMRAAMAPLVDAVALFQDNSVEEVREVVRLVRPSLLQFHGREDDAFCRGFGVPYLKAIPMGGGARAPAALELHRDYPGAAGFVFDGHAQGEPGGGGRAFDWTRLPQDLTKPALLAGGLTPATCSMRSPPRCPGAWTCPAASSPSRASRTASGCAASSRKCGARTATSRTIPTKAAK